MEQASRSTAQRVSVPCPVCKTPFVWPPTARCVNCRADLQGPVAAALWQVARDEVELRTRREELWRQLAETAVPLVPAPATSVRSRRRLDELGAQTLLGLAGAALLALAAVVFAAVTWQDLSTGARSAILAAATGLAAAAAWWLERRHLRVTAGAMGLLSDALAATVVWAAHSYGATGALVDAGGAALAALSAALVAVGLQRWGIAWQRGAAVVAWLVAVASTAVAVIDATPRPALPLVLLMAAGAAAVPARFTTLPRLRVVLLTAGGLGLGLASVMSAVVVAGTDGAAVTLPLATGVAAGSLWWRVAGPTTGVGAATATFTSLSIGVLGTFDLQLAVLMVGVAAVALATVVVASAVPPRHLPLLVGATPVTLPTVLWAGWIVLSAAAGWGADVGAVWQGFEPAAGAGGAWVAAVPVFAVCAGVLAVVQLRPRSAVAALLVMAPIAASASLWHLDAHPFVLAVVAISASVAGAMVPGSSGRWVFAAWLPIAVGWAAPSAGASAVAAVLAAGLTAAALRAPVGRHVEHAALLVALTAFATAATVVLLAPDGRTQVVAGSLGVVAAVAVGVVGRWLRLDAVVSGVSVTVVGAVSATAVGVLDGPVGAAVVTGVLTVGALLLAVTHLRTPIAARIDAAVAAAGATTTSWLLLSDAGVTIPEAYTAVPAVLALTAGTAWMVRDRTVRSIRALQPGLVLAVVPTAALLVRDPADIGRAVATALVAAVAMLAGVAGRAAAPVWYGAGAAATVVTTQLAVAVGHVPRWVTFAVVGGVLVVGSATFERQRLRARRIGLYVSRMTDRYR